MTATRELSAIVRLQSMPRDVPLSAVRIWTAADTRWGAPYQAGALIMGEPPVCELGLLLGAWTRSMRDALEPVLWQAGFREVVWERYRLVQGAWAPMPYRYFLNETRRHP